MLNSLVGALHGGGGEEGVSYEEFDELSLMVQSLVQRAQDVESAVEDLYACKADKSDVSTLARALNELWKAVKEIQAPEGMLHRA